MATKSENKIVEVPQLLLALIKMKMKNKMKITKQTILEKQRGRTDVSDATVTVNVFVSICLLLIDSYHGF